MCCDGRFRYDTAREKCIFLFASNHGTAKGLGRRIANNHNRQYAVLSCRETTRDVAVCGKHPHKTRRKAMTHLRRNRESHPYDGEVYYCQECAAWHVGRPAPWRKTVIPKKRILEQITENEL